MVAYLVGCDFSSRPSRRKPIVFARGQRHGSGVLLQQLEQVETLEEFRLWLCVNRDWVAAFDFPFGLPRELVEALGWPSTWEACMRHYAGLSRQEIRAAFFGFCETRPVGAKFAHRATDRPAGSSASMKWVNPPVAYMVHAGVPALIDAGVHIPGLHAGLGSDVDQAGRARRVALEAYPGMLARSVLGARSYKSDERSKQTPQRLENRAALLYSLETGNLRLGFRLQISPQQRETLLQDASGDSLDAVLCLLQAAWGSQRGWPWYGLPETLDPLEGWIVGAGSA